MDFDEEWATGPRAQPPADGDGGKTDEAAREPAGAPAGDGASNGRRRSRARTG